MSHENEWQTNEWSTEKKIAFFEAIEKPQPRPTDEFVERLYQASKMLLEE